MKNRANISQLIEAVLATAGDTDTVLRKAAKNRSSGHANGFEAKKLTAVPQELEAYVDKVANHAYKVTDEDINGLLKTGYSEDAVFEITLSAALGAGVSRLNRGLSALKGEHHET